MAQEELIFQLTGDVCSSQCPSCKAVFHSGEKGEGLCEVMKV